MKLKTINDILEVEMGSIRLTRKTIEKCIGAGCKTVGDMETILKARRAIRNKK